MRIKKLTWCQLAIAGGHIELTKLLMSFGADLDLQDDEGM